MVAEALKQRSVHRQAVSPKVKFSRLLPLLLLLQSVMLICGVRPARTGTSATRVDLAELGQHSARGAVKQVERVGRKAVYTLELPSTQ